MGIPRYFKYIAKSFKGLLYNAPNEAIYPMHFYLDMNSLIHPCVQYCIEQYPAYVSEQNRIQEDSTHKYHKQADYHTRFEKAVYGELDKRLVHLIKDIVRPTHTLYLAVDGVAPRAKMEQQRIRRYKSAYETKQTNAIFDKYGLQANPSWDRNAITPGTVFLYKLCKHLECEFLPKIKAEMSIPEVYIDDANSPGEGEHKIFDWMRTKFTVKDIAKESDADSPQKEFHCIYGLDADLIMLSLCNPNSIVLLRESPEYFDKNDASTQITSEYIYFHMDAYKDRLVENINGYINELVEKENKADDISDVDSDQTNDEDVSGPSEVVDPQDPKEQQMTRQGFLYDYVWMCFIFGNDFLPHAFGFEINQESFEVMMRQYANQFRVMKRNFIDPKSMKLDLLAVKQWFETLFGREPDRVRKYIDSIRYKKPYNQSTTQNKYPPAVQRELDELRIEPYRQRFEKKKIQVVEQSFRDIDNPYQNWRDVYYNWYFGIESLEVNRGFVERICQHYLYGLDWNMQYYIHGCKDQTWYYPFRAAPSLRELVVYLSKQMPVLSPLSKQLLQAYNPVEQLMLVLPISSVGLLPSPVKDVVSSIEYSHYYPDKVGMDVLFKTYLYECVPYLPYLPEEVVLKVIKKTQAKWNAFDTLRNQRTGVTMVQIATYSK